MTSERRTRRYIELIPFGSNAKSAVPSVLPQVVHNVVHLVRSTPRAAPSVFDSRPRLLASSAALLTAALVLSSCGSKSSDSDTASAGSGSGAKSCVDTSGDTIKLGFLNSTSGAMAISEQTVRDSLMMAADEINADGGILGKEIEPVVEDGASDPAVFAEKIGKLITSDCVAATFGGWTSASRKAMLPVVEGANGLLFYPVQYEGLEASKHIYYTGATTNQQIIPAMDFLKEQG